MKMTMVLRVSLSIATLILPVATFAEKHNGGIIINATSEPQSYSTLSVVAKKGFLRKFLKAYFKTAQASYQELTYQLESRAGARVERVNISVRVGQDRRCSPRNISRLINKLGGKTMGFGCGFITPVL